MALLLFFYFSGGCGFRSIEFIGNFYEAPLEYEMHRGTAIEKERRTRRHFSKSIAIQFINHIHNAERAAYSDLVIQCTHSLPRTCIALCVKRSTNCGKIILWLFHFNLSIKRINNLSIHPPNHHHVRLFLPCHAIQHVQNTTQHSAAKPIRWIENFNYRKLRKSDFGH